MALFISKSIIPTFLKKILNIVFYRGYSVYLKSYSFDKRVVSKGESVLIKGSLGNNGIHKRASVYLIYKIINPYHPEKIIFNSDTDLKFEYKRTNRTSDIIKNSTLDFAFTWEVPENLNSDFLYIKIEIWSPRKLYREKSLFYYPYQFDTSGWKAFIEIVENLSYMTMQPKIFISYAWASESHKSWVKELADELTKHNMTILFDRDLLPGQEITRFMERGVKEADIILLICSEVFTQKANNREGGAGYETILHTKKYMNTSVKEKFIPIIKDNNLKPNEKIPDFLGSTLYVDMDNQNWKGEPLQKLIQAINRLTKISTSHNNAKPTS